MNGYLSKKAVYGFCFVAGLIGFLTHASEITLVPSNEWLGVT